MLRIIVMATKGCKLIENCPIFQKGVLISEKTGEAYKNIYCLDPRKFVECKRYLVTQETNLPIPEYVLPNTSFSPKAIIEKIEKELK